MDLNCNQGTQSVLFFDALLFACVREHNTNRGTSPLCNFINLYTKQCMYRSSQQIIRSESSHTSTESYSCAKSELKVIICNVHFSLMILGISEMHTQSKYQVKETK